MAIFCAKLPVDFFPKCAIIIIESEREVMSMKATGIIRRFDDLGRIVIPKEIRKQIFGTKNSEGMPMEIFMDKDNIILRKYEENKDDVCEWKLKDACYTSSIKHYDALPTSIVKTFTSCPYCGKKIKVVE